MPDPQIRFSDGASYDLMMGAWSRSVGEIFLDWIEPEPRLQWIDIGCGSGAFTSLVVERCAPASIIGIDPSEAQIDFARRRGRGGVARFESGDAMDLDIAAGSVDIAVSALVVHFMPDPARGVAEMARVTRRGGMVASYAWDLVGGGFPYEPVHVQMRAIGTPPPPPPHPEAAEAAGLQRLWTAAGLVAIAQREIIVERTFENFERYWQLATTSPRIEAALNKLPADTLVALRESVWASLPAGTGGIIAVTARANAIVGRVPQ